MSPSSSKKPAGSRKAQAASRRASRSSAPIQPARPWGLILGSVLLAAALIGTVVFAYLNQGSGRFDPTDIRGVVVFDDLARDHVDGELPYESVPPVGGQHSSVWQDCTAYGAPIPTEHAVHSLEHGAVWITYRPDLAQEDANYLTSLAYEPLGEGYLLVSPMDGLPSKVVLSAWGHQLRLDSVRDERLEQFIKGFVQGPQTPERGAVCSGGNSTYELATPGGPSGSSPAPSASAAPSAPPAPVSRPPGSVPEPDPSDDRYAPVTPSAPAASAPPG